MNDLAYQIAKLGIMGLALVFVIHKQLSPQRLLPKLFSGGASGQGSGVALKDIEAAIQRYSYKDFFVAIMQRMGSDKLELERQSNNVSLPPDLSRAFKNDILRFG